MIEPPALVGLGPCSAAIHGVSYVSSFSTVKLRESVLTSSFAGPLPWIVNVHVDAKLHTPLHLF